MGISEPVLEEEGSLIAGWRAKFGEENHQVIAQSLGLSSAKKKFTIIQNSGRQFCV